MARSSRFFPPLMALSVSLFACAGDGGDTEPLSGVTGHGSPGDHVVATFLAPSLDEAGTHALVAALAANPGILTAAADADSGLFRVAFTVEKTSPSEVLGLVTKTNTSLTLRDVAQVSGGSASACSDCPSQATCGSAKPSTGE